MPSLDGVEEAAALLAELVATPGITLEAGQRAPDDRHGEARMAVAVAAYLERHGIEPEIEEIEPGRPQVTARIGSGAPELLLTSHLDTVEPVGWVDDPFQPVRDGDRLQGLGACDDKASLTAMLLAFTRVARRPERLRGTLTFIGMVGEERFGVGARHLVRRGYRPDAAIVGEPTELRLVRAECGNVRWRVRALGRAAHGSRPWEGESAIYGMAEVLRVLRDEVAPDVRSRCLPRELAALEGLGPAAVNVGEIAGGSGVNVVPDRCAIHLERRVLPGEDPTETMDEINALLRERLPGVRLEFDPPGAINYPMATPADAPLVLALQECLRRRGLNPEPAGVTFGSDANRLAAGNIPCIVFGPGSISQAHTAGEWVDLKQVALAASVLDDAARRWMDNAA